MSNVLEPISANDQQDAVEAFGKALRIVHPHARLITPDGSEIPIPEPIYKILAQVIPQLVSGNAVSIVPVGHLLTTQEAADILNVSRPYLVKLLEKGTLPYERSDDPGSHRRIKFVDLMKYKHKLNKEKRKHLKELTELSQDAGLYDD